jgi:hypothetical protein
VREYELLFHALAERVPTARLSTGYLRDAADFKAWLLELADHAALSNTVEEFFGRIK